MIITNKSVNLMYAAFVLNLFKSWRGIYSRHIQKALGVFYVLIVKLSKAIRIKVQRAN